jgi:thioredoxin reductase (NADPH)
MNIYDSIIVGGGPAGLSAAIYLARFNRSVLILDREDGRWDSYEMNENYLGFPDGIPSRELRARGLMQAKRYGAEYKKEIVEKIKKTDSYFQVTTSQDSYHAKSIILAMGVKDNYPLFTNWKEFLGKSLFWCITCDGYKTRNKTICIVGQTDEAVCTTLQFLEYTKEITFVTHTLPGQHTISDKRLSDLQKAGIPFIEEMIQDIKGSKGFMNEILLENGQSISAQFLFNEQPSIPNTNLAHQLYVKTNEEGYILTDNDQRTNIPFVYAAGDITKNFAHQIVTAAHEGSMAAQTANYDLYNPEQRDD